ncbi:MAG: protein-disulfide reductase DsbD [Gammaproteobacteria bacterium]|nr:protein-disulfide reductase DsbD [Gammaproteobacteria bacterium]
MRRSLLLSLPCLLLMVLGAPAAQANTGAGAVDAFKAFFSHRHHHRFLRRSAAYRLTLKSPDPSVIRAHFHIARGYYLYQDKIHFKLMAPRAGVTLGPVAMPPATIEHNPYLGTLTIYKRSFVVPLPLTGARPGETLHVQVHYQGCATAGICYPPVTRVIDVTTPAALAAPAAPAPPRVAAAPAAAAKTVPAPAGAPLAKPVTLSAGTPALTLSTWVSALIAAFGVGLLLTFTPCVLPMIPIVSSMLVGQGQERLTKTRGGLLSLAYVLGTGTTYAIAGALAGATGDELQASFENAWGIGALSLLFVLMALSLFGVFSLQMPTAIQSRVQGRAGGGRRSLAHAYVLGLLSALVVGACVSPLLVSALGLAISAHSAALGAAVMFAIALGMGVLLIALGVGAGHLLPKAGPWMDTIKNFFGVLLLGVAIYLLGLLPAVPVLYLWGALFVMVGVYLGAGRTSAAATPRERIAAGIGTILLLWGALSILGGLQGRRDPLHPLTLASAPRGAAAAPVAQARFHKVTSIAGLDAALAQARAQRKPALVDFTASWCVDCQQLKRNTFPDRRVQKAMKGFMLIEADVTDDTPATRTLEHRYGIFGPPALLFFDRKGHLLNADNFYGYMGPGRFAALLRRVKGT